MTSDAVRWPAPTGENVTAMLQLVPAGYAPEHALFTWKSARFAPLGSTEEMCSDALPELVTVMFCTRLELPSVAVAKLRLPGVRVTARTGDAPSPLARVDCGLPAPLPRPVRPARR